MRRVMLLLLAVVVVPVLLSCTRTVYVPTQPHRSEMIVTRDTVIEVVTEGELQRNKTADTVSVLCAERAYSVASVAQGVLSHSLSVLPRRDSIRLQWREVHTIDSVPYLVPMPGERVEVVPAWMWWAVVAMLLGNLVLIYVLARLRK